MQRIRQAAAATLQITTTDSIGVPADVAGAMNVTVRRADGTTLIASTAATVDPAAGVYTTPLTPAQTATLDVLEATWHDVAGDVDWTSQHRIVGGFMFSIAEARAYEAAINDAAKYSNVLVAATRNQVEEEAEWICDRRFVPTYDRVTVDGDGTSKLFTRCHDLRRIRAITVYEELNGTPITLTAGELAGIALQDEGVIVRTDGEVFPWGQRNIILDLEYGLDGPEEQMAKAAIVRLRSRLLAPSTGMPERTRSVSDANGNTYQLNGADPYTTGIDSVDAVYGRFSKRRRGNAAGDGAVVSTGLPASRTLSYDPQAGSLFRGGPR